MLLLICELTATVLFRCAYHNWLINCLIVCIFARLDECCTSALQIQDWLTYWLIEVDTVSKSWILEIRVAFLWCPWIMMCSSGPLAVYVVESPVEHLVPLVIRSLMILWLFMSVNCTVCVFVCASIYYLAVHFWLYYTSCKSYALNALTWQYTWKHWTVVWSRTLVIQLTKWDWVKLTCLFTLSVICQPRDLSLSGAFVASQCTFRW